jgi:hypothetical protein
VLLADIQLRENELGGRKIYKRKQHGFWRVPMIRNNICDQEDLY